MYKLKMINTQNIFELLHPLLSWFENAGVKRLEGCQFRIDWHLVSILLRGSNCHMKYYFVHWNIGRWPGDTFMEHRTDSIGNQTEGFNYYLIQL